MSRVAVPRMVGSVLVLLGPILGLCLVLSPGVREPLRRTFATLAADTFSPQETPWRFTLEDTSHVARGHPVFCANRPGALEPVAWVSQVEPGTSTVWIRFAPGESGDGTWRLRAIGAPTDLGDAFELAVPPEVADELGRRLSERVTRLFAEIVKPEVERRMPDFLARIDPRHDPKARVVFEEVGGAVVARLRPLADDLTGEVVDDLEKHFDFLERVGLLWKVVRGDGKGLGRALVPVAERSVERWWKEHQGDVLTAVGAGLEDTAPRWQAWLSTEVLEAARDELAMPILEAQRPRFEREAEDAIDDVLDAVVNAPDGGFRVRFAAALRSQLLDKDAPLLLLEPQS